MNFEDCQSLWRRQGTPIPSAAERDQLLSCVAINARRFDRSLFWRDMREISVGFLVAALFAVAAWEHTANGYVPWGRWAAVALTLAVILRFLSARRLALPPPAEGQPLLEHLDFDLSALRGQVRCLRKVPTHYVMPLFVAILGAGLDPFVQKGGFRAIWSGPGLLVIVVALTVCGGAIAINRIAVARVLRPRIAELQRLREELTSG